MADVGLRELKKNKLRQAVQREAFRLFTEQGYPQTTVEQIAEAAEISTTTFYRYYSSKEDIVFTGDYDPAAGLDISVFTDRPADEPLTSVIRSILRASLDPIRQDKSAIVARLRLVLNVPELREASARRQEEGLVAAAALVAARNGGEPASSENRFTAAVLQAGLMETMRYWVSQDGEPDVAELVALIDHALDRLAPVIDR